MSKAVTVSCLVVGTLLSFTAIAVRARQDTREEEVAHSFDVVSIKPVDGRPPSGSSASPNRFVDPSATLYSLIQSAYQVSRLRLVGGDEWMQKTRYSVNAVAESALSASQMQSFMRALLKDRFGLRLHTEQREMPVFTLMLTHPGQLGPKIKASAIDCTQFFRGGLPMPGPPVDVTGSPLCAIGGGVTEQALVFRLRGVPIAALGSVLETRLQRPVIDDTGLAGTFDIDLTARREAAGAKTTGADVPDLFTALDEQLGLRVRSERRLTDVIVIDAAHFPSPD
jgi:uncharacterized protein (TIGR03435 family)